MPAFLQQFTLKDLLTYLLLGLSIWYNTQNNQASRDAEQDKQLALQAQTLSTVLESNKQLTTALQEVHDGQLRLSEQVKHLSK